MSDQEIILQQDVDPIGKMGDVVKVSAGFARNYLLPRRIAVVADPENRKRIEKLKRQRAAIEVKRVEEAQALAGQLAATEVSIEATTTETGQLYGSVGAREIAVALEAKGVKVAERDVRLQHPLKELGVFPVKIHLRGDVSAEIKVWVVEAKKAQQ